MKTQNLVKKWSKIFLREKKKFKKRHSTKMISDCMFVHNNMDRFQKKIHRAEENYYRFCLIHEGGFRQLSKEGRILMNRYANKG